MVRVIILPIDILRLSITTPDAAYSRQKAREIATFLGFSLTDQTRIATAVSEIVRNTWQYAGGGQVTFSLVAGTRQLFQIQVEDNGPGIADLDAILARSFTDISGTGRGIIGARGIMDAFEIRTVLGQETQVTMGKYLPRHVPILTEERLAALVEELARRLPLTPMEELHRQNQELLQTLREIQLQQVNWEQLYREMEVTNRDMLAIHDELSEQNQALQRSEARFRQMVDEVKDYAIFLLDAQGRIATWNIGAERTLGYTEPEVIGSQGEIIFSDEQRAANKPTQEMQTARDAGRAVDEYYLLRKDGSSFWANSVVTALWDAGELVGYVKILRDITEQKQAQDALQTAYQRERHITAVLQSPLIQNLSEKSLPGLSVVTLYESALDEAEVGGDFFDAFRLDSGKIALAVGDASGKGLEAALRAMQVKQVLQGAFVLVNAPSPVRVVEQLNRYLYQFGENLDVNTVDARANFVTLALVVLDPLTGQGISVAAGCEPTLILRATGEAEPLPSSDLPLGILGEHAYKSTSFVLRPGDSLILLTDGITEARSHHELLGYERMITLAQEGATLPTLQEMGHVILEGARTFAKGKLRDDVCLLIAQLK